MVAAGTVLLPYFTAMFLGRTIDLSTYNVGANVYDDIDSIETKINRLNATYYVIDTKSFPYEFLGVPPDVVLRMKSNFLSAGSFGLGGLMNDLSGMRNSAIVVVRATYSAVERSLKGDAKPLSNWNVRVTPSSTHYSSSVTMGGWIAVVYRFRCQVPSDVNIIQKTLIDQLGRSGQLGKEAAELYSKVETAVLANKEVRGTVTLEKNVYSTVTSHVSDITSLMKAIEELPRLVGPVGSAISMKLKPLHSLDSKYPEVQYNSELLEDLSTFDRMLDDVKDARANILKWIRVTTTVFTEKQEKQIAKLLSYLNQCLKEFYVIIGETSLYGRSSDEDIQKGFSTYLKGLGRGSPTYYIAFLRLKEDIDTNCKNEYLNGIRGLLDVFQDERHTVFEVRHGGIEDCKMECSKDKYCRSIGYSDLVTERDESTGSYIQKKRRCWIYHRSSSTAPISTPSGMFGEIHVYDRVCY